MIQSSQWQCLTVQDFFEQNYWSGNKLPQVSTSNKPEDNSAQDETLKNKNNSKKLPSQKDLEEKVSPKVKISTPSKKLTHNLSWQCLSVEDFFAQNYWSDTLKEIEDKSSKPKTLETEEIIEETSNTKVDITQDKPRQFSTTLLVTDFFKMIEWEGQPVIAALPQLEKKDSQQTSSSDDLTITDLSDLF